MYVQALIHIFLWRVPYEYFQFESGVGTLAATVAFIQLQCIVRSPTLAVRVLIIWLLKRAQFVRTDFKSIG